MLNTNDRIIKHKIGLLNLAEELGNVSKACQVMGMSRDTFYRYESAVEEGGVGEGSQETQSQEPYRACYRSCCAGLVEAARARIKAAKKLRVSRPS